MADKAGDDEEEEGESSGEFDDRAVVIILADMEDVRGAIKGSSQRC
jgi:hypothetical protein